MAKRHRKLGWVRWTIIILMLLVMVLSISLIIYSQLSVWESQQEIRNIVESWREQVLVPNTEPKVTLPDTPTSPADTVESVPETELDPLDQLLEAMRDFNREIYVEGQTSLVDAFSYQNEVFNLTEYGLESGLFGVISIPKINVELPLYLGASYEHLSYGFAQLSQTSFPIGGNNTNCVVACHRGWRGMAFMRDCELLSEGDSVFVENPWETLEYRLVEVRIIEPNETENILIQANRDLLTIVTCHPYRVGSHRYLLICERYIPEEVPPAAPS